MKIFKTTSSLLFLFGALNHPFPSTASVNVEDVNAVKSKLRGSLYVRDVDEGYEAVRKELIWNLDPTIDNSPEVIVRPVGTSDIVLALDLAKSQSLKLNVRGGGHSIPGRSTNKDGLVIDMSLMRSVRVNQKEKTVWFEGGALLGDVDAETTRYGLATVLGTAPCTGVGGLVSGGGFGYLSPLHGYSVDQMVEVEVVTYEGDLVTANEEENADLFWGVRGGGGNFGVIKSITMKLHDIPEKVYGGMILWHIEKFESLYKEYTAFLESERPKGAMVFMMVMNLEDIPVAGILASYIGDPDVGKSIFSHFDALGDPLTPPLGPMTYMELQTMAGDGFCPQAPWHFSSTQVSDIPDLEFMKANSVDSRPPTGMVLIETWGHGDKAPSSTATAMVSRNVKFHFITAVLLVGEDSEADRAWSRHTRDKVAALEVNHELTYSNYETANLSEDHPVSDRFSALKQKFDPHNFFTAGSHIQLAPMTNEL